MNESKRPPLAHAAGTPVTDNLNIQTAGPARSGALLQDVWLIEKLAHFAPRSDPGAPHARQGLRRPRHLHRHARHHALHQGQDIFEDRQADPDVRPLLHGRRRARRRRRRTRHPRLRAEVLYGRGQLGRRRQQHTGVLLPRPAAVSRSQPRDQARPAHRYAQRRQQLGLLDAAAGSPAPGHDRQ